MVVQKAIDNLKDKPKDDRQAVAGSIAGAVVLVLLIGWGLLFFRNLQKGSSSFESAQVQQDSGAEAPSQGTSQNESNARDPFRTSGTTE